jgi:hypothetical protein
MISFILFTVGIVAQVVFFLKISCYYGNKDILRFKMRKKVTLSYDVVDDAFDSK